MRVCSLFLISLLLYFPILRAASEPQKKNDPTKDIGPIEIDFAPMEDPALKVQYQITIWLRSVSGGEFKEVYTTDPPMSAKDFQRIVKSSVESVGWQAREEGDTKLVIEKHKKGALNDYKIKAEFTDKKNPKKLPQPKVRRLREENTEKK
jgi:hypothetical protein